MRKLSVIILCHNNLHIDKVVESVICQEADTDETFVVDDHSDLPIKALLEDAAFKNVKILHPAEKGNRSANRNLAAKQATGDLFVFIDGDVLIEKGALDKIRLLDFENITGACGAVAAIRMQPESVAIDCKSYQIAINPWERDFDFWHSRYPDARVRTNALPWNRFYTAFSVIPRDKFFAVGQFDEVFCGWGGEDIDIGYRLSKLGELQIFSDIRGVHIPHRRNIRKEELSGRKNMYQMLNKYRNRDMEELLSFALSSSAHEGMETVLEKMRTFPDTFDRKPDGKDLVLSVVSCKNPNGKIAYKNNGETKEEEFIGLALPFEEGRFENAYTSTDIFSYPEVLATRIIQEMLRVSKEVHIYKSLPKHIQWEGVEEKFKYIFCYYKIYLFSDSYQDFDIRDCGEYYTVE